MTTIMLPIDIDTGIDVLGRLRQMSDDEFFNFCQENADYKFERDADGTIISMVQTGGATGERNSEITTELMLWNRKAKLGFVYDSSTGFRLPNGATRGPDAAWILVERRNALTPEQRQKFFPLCPDFVVELMSLSDSLKETDEKLREYIENGCRLGWLIDPRTEESRVYRADGSISVFHGFDNALSGEDVLPSFTFDLVLLR